MPSVKSKLFNFVLRNRHLLQGKLRKETFDADTSIPAFRELCEKGAARMAKVPPGVRVERFRIEELACERLIPAAADPSNVVLYVHGGGYVSGSCSDHRGFVAKFAASTGVTNLTYEYRLAPEHPHPAAIEDSVTVYRWLLDNGYASDKILIAGESAGGGLSLALLLALKDRAIPLPCAAVAISPWTDLTCSGDSYKSKNAVSVAPLNSWNVFSAHYVGSLNAELPLVSPLFGDLAGLPPLLINAGADDELYDDGERFYRKAKSSGVDVSFRRGDGMVHCYPLLAPMFPEATQAMDEIVAFVRTHFKMV